MPSRNFKVLCVIPARIGSTRLKRKALALLGNKPMVQRTYEAAIQCPDLDDVIVATDSEEISSVIKSCNGKVEMTDKNIQTGSDRVAVVASRYPEMDVIINLQGDEPFIKPQMLTELAAPFFSDNPPQMATLAYELKSDELKNPDIVKVITDKNGDAIYFSRSPIPFQRDLSVKINTLHHMGIYAYTKSFLKLYTKLPQTTLEIAEKLEQLRAIENGYKIRVCYTEHRTLEINTPEELEKARELIASNDNF